MLDSTNSKQSLRQDRNDHAAAAVDLIRNLDKALLGMNAAAHSASENAARARRNAKAAREIARRYGGGKKLKMKAPPGQQQEIDNGSDNGLLEKTRERRSMARMTAEARHWRDNPVISASPSSPRRLGIPNTPTSIVFEASLLSAEEDNDDDPTLVKSAVVVENKSTDDMPSHVRVSSSEGFEDAMEHHHDDCVAQTYNAEGVECPLTTHVQNIQQYSYYHQQHSCQEQQPDEMQCQQYPHSSQMTRDQEGGEDGTDFLQHQFYDNEGYYYPNKSMQNEQPQSQPIAAVSASATTAPSPPNTHNQSMNASRIEDSHVEDVLSLSLELERVRSQLATTVQQLTDATSQVTTLKGQNDHLREELSTLHSQLEVHNERSIAQVEQLKVEQYKSKAAEEDALEALELAKESQSSKEELEIWLYQCLDDRDLWKGRCMEIEDRYREEQNRVAHEVEMGGLEEPKKVVRFKQNVEEDLCDPPLVVGKRTISTPRPPSQPPCENLDSPSQPSYDGTPSTSIQLFTPSSSTTTTTPPSLENGITLSKSTAIASGRAILFRASAAASSPSVSLSSASPSPYKQQGLSPHPRMQASDLLKKSAETRRLLRERLIPGRLGGRQHGIPLPKHITSSLSLNSDGFASRQGAACKAVGRAIRESGERLKLNGIWWSSRIDTVNIENNGLVPLEGDVGAASGTPASLVVKSCNYDNGNSLKSVAELESMVQEYCGKVENTIGQQQRKIDELLAFCDLLEKGVVDNPPT